MSLHPFFVHFPIAFWLLGSLVLLASVLWQKERWWETAWFLLLLATVTVIPTVLSGQDDYVALAAENHAVVEQHRDFGNLLPWLMGVTCLLFLHGRFAKGAKALPRPAFAVIVLILAGFILYTGYLGGSLIHLHQLHRP